MKVRTIILSDFEYVWSTEGPVGVLNILDEEPCKPSTNGMGEESSAEAPWRSAPKPLDAIYSRPWSQK